MSNYVPYNRPANAKLPPIKVSSAYRADFYIAANIIGFTGDLHNNPTVYFLSDTEFGHITQYHKTAWNIGRETVGDRFPMPGWNYKIKNIPNNGRDEADEAYYSDEGEYLMHIHPSRNPFYDTQRANMRTLSILSQAIWQFTSEKQRPKRK